MTLELAHVGTLATRNYKKYQKDTGGRIDSSSVAMADDRKVPLCDRGQRWHKWKQALLWPNKEPRKQMLRRTPEAGPQCGQTGRWGGSETEGAGAEGGHCRQTPMPRTVLLNPSLPGSRAWPKPANIRVNTDRLASGCVTEGVLCTRAHRDR